MKMITTLVSCVLVAACAQPASTDANAPAASTPAASMPAAGTDAPAAVASPSGTMGMQMAGTPAMGSGTVESVDAAAGKISISHGPVAALGWPAMTMNFKATPAQIASVHAGQAIEFDFVAEGMQGTITAIRSPDAGK